MSRKNSFLSRFARYLFRGEIEYPRRTYEVFSAEIERALESEPQSEQASLSLKESEIIEGGDSRVRNTREKVTNQIIVRINSILSFICLVSFVAMIIYSFVYPDKVIPDAIKFAFSSTLGWLGNAFVSFLQLDNKTQNENQ